MDPLADVFDLSRVSGAMMAQLIACEPWGVAVDPVPGAVFHALVAGSCWLRMSGRAPQRLMPGDVVLLPTNTPHELVSSVDGAHGVAGAIREGRPPHARRRRHHPGPRGRNARALRGATTTTTRSPTR